MTQHTYNNGKDVMPDDIRYVQVKPNIVHAYLGFIQIPKVFLASVDTESPEPKPKYYQATGSTKEEARRDLIQCMIDDLKRIQ